MPTIGLNRLLELLRYILGIRIIEAGLVAINGLGFLIGALYWYMPQMLIVTPILWPWLIDSPLSTLGFAIALPLIRRRPKQWFAQLIATWSLFSNVKYGLWTVLFWTLWWRGPGSFTLESVTMTFTHAAMILMGLCLLLFYRPRIYQVLVVAVWFAFNDYLDYWHGIAPTVPPGVDLTLLQWEQVFVTAIMTVATLVLAWRSAAVARRRSVGSGRNDDLLLGRH